MRFTRIPKIRYLVDQGVPAEVIPTYCCLSDYANNKSGLCWPKMETLARTLNRSVRTVQRHLHLLKEKGLIEFVERRRHKGRFSSYLYRVLHITKTTGHGKRMAGRSLYKRGTKSSLNSPREQISAIDREHREQTIKARKGEQHRKRGYEWFFE